MDSQLDKPTETEADELIALINAGRFTGPGIIYFEDLETLEAFREAAATNKR